VLGFLGEMTKKPPIRKDEQALSDKEMLRRWLYGEPCLDKVEEDQPAGCSLMC